MPNILSIKGKHPASPAVSPWRQALNDNLREIRELRAKFNVVADKDRAAAKDIAAADATVQRVQMLQESIDSERAEASYAGDPAPDLKHLEKQLIAARLQQRDEEAVARAASVVRMKFGADMAKINAEISERARVTQKLLFDALREDCLARLAPEFLAAEAAFLEVYKRTFAAALAVDVISREQSFGQFVGSGGINELRIPRPEHPAFDLDAGLSVEQRHAKRAKYIQDASEASATLVLELLKGGE
jgi:hypothetical protein